VKGDAMMSGWECLKEWVKKHRNILSAIGLLLLMFGTPVFLNFFVFEYPNPKTNGTLGDWMGFFSNYSGGIIGGIVAYVIAKQQTDAIKEDKKSEEVEKEQFIISIIENFLGSEVKRNFRNYSLEYIENFKKHSDGEALDATYVISKGFKYDNYDDIKFELAKYNAPIVRETIEIYQVFKSLEHEDSINDMDRKKAEACYVVLRRWYDRLDRIKF
jgi:hypothetical protein